MSVKIKVSYQNEQELKFVLGLLDVAIKSWKKASEKSGKFNKVYIELK
jgi:hypothetical protein